MALFDVADCLAHIRRICRIPDVTEYPADADLYAYLRDGENRVKHEFGAVAPAVLIGAPTLLTSTDGGYTYPFGTDAGTNAIAPIGHLRVYASKAHIPFEPLQANTEYVFEGTKIRMVQNSPRTFADGPYAQWIIPTYTIDGSSNAMTLPVQLRLLAVYAACSSYAISGGALDNTPYEALYAGEFSRQVATAQLNGVAGTVQYPRALARATARMY